MAGLIEADCVQVAIVVGVGHVLTHGFIYPYEPITFFQLLVSK